ncbi:zinc finger protein ZAT5-like [Nymphaea colorata]|uniref:C2H2-type domain-containing protein n=1 Tax=Nymphaea colorata TaxID=210225 RepID=A0A5K0YNG2_9MAGN|nr:zinc finger protein ZAT5-like [Nymphaea colorata]VVV79681.1 unnamed protein product [Nymphaea colorata]
MEMEATEEAMDVGHGRVVRGKRTKRQRQSPPLAMGSTSNDERLLSSPASTTSTGEDNTEEDEDMANCLILLAQSGRGGGPCLNSAGPPEAAAEPRPNGRRGELYECKTCNKCFPSFQALGGHRASHKKPKTAAAAAAEEEKEKERAVVAEEERLGLVLMQQQLGGSGTKVGGKVKVHECSICGSEFTSGQALGGHMRRHRVVPESPESKKPKSVFTLDLNLPAPDDSDTVEFSKFQTGSEFTREQPIMFAALVDCHN